MLVSTITFWTLVYKINEKIKAVVIENNILVSFTFFVLLCR